MAGKKEDSAHLLVPDPFLETLNHWASWVQKHLKMIVGVLAGALAVILAFEFFSSQSERDAAAITTELTEAVKKYEEATDPQKVLTSTKADAMKEPLEKAREKLDAVVKAHPKHGAAQLARLYVADVDRRLKLYAEAEAAYKSYADNAKKDDNLLFLALEGAGYALEDQGKLDEALVYFNRLVENGGFYKDFGLKHKARVLEKKGDKDGAIAALKSIVDIQPPSELRGQAEERLKALQ